MNRSEQKNFVREHLASFAHDLCRRIDLGHIPLEWDGHELRCVVAEKAKEAARFSDIRRHPHCKRAKDYRNIVAVNNL